MSVYFAQAGGYIKIGYSARPIARASTITVAGVRPDDLPRASDARLIGWIPGDTYDEQALQAQFREFRVAGEWFKGIDVGVLRDLIWSDPRGVDMERMSAMAVFAADRYPGITRGEIAQAGIRVEAAPWPQVLTSVDAQLIAAARQPA